MEEYSQKIWPRELRVAEDKRSYYKDLEKHEVFRYYNAPMKQIFLYSMALGYHNNYFVPLANKKGTVPTSNLTEKEKWLLYSVALTREQNNIKILAEINTIIDIVEQYANGGIKSLYDMVMTTHSVGGVLKKLDEDILKSMQPRTKPEVTIPEQNKEDDNIKEIISKGENSQVEFKASLLWDYENKSVNKELQYVIARSIASFLNSQNGGTLIVGVKDTGEILGIENDLKESPLKHPNKDGFYLKVGEIIDNYLGKLNNKFINTEFTTIDNKIICIIKIKKSSDKVFLRAKNNNIEFHVRIGNRTNKLEGEEMITWIRENWPK